MIRKFFKFCLIWGTVLFLLASIAGVVVGLRFYHQLTRDLPRIERLSDYQPKAVTQILAADGTLVGEAYDERRYPVDFSEIPLVLRQAFLAAEDANFYTHPGIDLTSILRALWVNLREAGTVQGGSTITQQVVKSLLLSRERTYERKAKEAILSYRLEQALSKDDIFSIYLNEIFLGGTAYGVKAAARVHFHKELDELNLAEAAYLAGLPPRPSYLSDPRNRADAMTRQRYVLRQMVENGYITEAERRQAEQSELVIYPPELQKIYHAPWYVTHVRRMLEEQLGRKLVNPGGYVVQTALDLDAYALAEHSVQKGLREVDKRRGWRGPLATIEEGSSDELLDSVALASESGLVADHLYRAVVRELHPRQGYALVQVGEYPGKLRLTGTDWANKYLNKDGDVSWIKFANYLKVGHVIEVSVDMEKTKPEALSGRDGELWFQLDQTPEVEGSFVCANALTGEIIALIGGYDFARSQFNRATQGLRQPGSSFKPFIYLSAIDFLGYTPASIVPDSPISMVDGTGKLWSPANYDRKYLGPITLRTALQRSRNVVSVYLLDKIGVERVIQTARRFGISTPIPAEMSIALGSAETKLIEMVNAYGTFAAAGWRAEPLVITKISDRDGTVIAENRPSQQQVISPDSAFIMANMMKGVVERGTAQVIKQLGRPVAGKTGTTNEQMDAWFIGYTPEWVAGAWVGFDVKRTIGRYETGGKAAAPIFLYFMQSFLEDKPALDFDIPDGVIPVPINLATGSLVDADAPGAFTEYFKIGTEPKYRRDDRAIPNDYLSSEEF
ncbi:MAG: PBP1A family penicillin-binding protein [Bdellovibrionales bacterium]|nr:PBP1A family penicillin-binding protein [Bdellovibrionales bacterium]